MRGTLARRFPNPNITKQTLIPSSAFSTSSGSSGRGRGRGSGIGSPGSPTQFEFTQAPGKPGSDESKPESSNESPPVPSGLGHGRGKPIPAAPSAPAFSSFLSSITPAAAGRGRVTTQPTESRPQQSESQGVGPKKPIFFRKDDEPIQKTQIGGSGKIREASDLPGSILSVLSTGFGRGKPTEQLGSEEKLKEENRHLRPRQAEPERGRGTPVSGAPRLSRDDAVKKAVGILSRSGDDGGGRGSAVRGRGRSGRGRGRGFSGGRGRGDRMDRRGKDSEDDYGTGLYLGDNADGERLADRVGPETMNKLVEAFEEMSGRVLPSPMEDAFLDAFHTNCSIEFEPEYLMEEFGTNPDIDEKPPIPLRDALEKMKPFLMAYDGIQSQQEWEEIMEETMEKVPYLKELVDYYSGPDRVTAKKQQEELERVAKTLPESAPASVKQFANRAVLSLQSNPGWGFDKKCQFMDKVAWEVSQHYK
ncbi:hypothetical protein L1049_005514 [Liquidambar formosana]|uniref:Hydroxyproline-rich glycoprotein family protein n=1 Tax=Liquidambar formosana TaxID=63359 RepID=A0AAP0N635_LIQFO